jgi:hypothetical protein
MNEITISFVFFRSPRTRVTIAKTSIANESLGTRYLQQNNKIHQLLILQKLVMGDLLNLAQRLG